MMNLSDIVHVIAKLFHKPAKQKILVSFHGDGKFVEDYAVDGVYYATWKYPGWKPGNFPLKLVDDGTGIILSKGLAGTGKPYPGFMWKSA